MCQRILQEGSNSPAINYNFPIQPAPSAKLFHLIMRPRLAMAIFNTSDVPAKDVVIDQVYIVAGNPTVDVPEPGARALLGLSMPGPGPARRRAA